MSRINDELKANGYNLRERLNIYAGAVLGVLAPIAFLKYQLTSGSEDLSLGKESLAWGLSVLGNIGMSFTCNGFPLLYTTLTGTVAGVLGAGNLKKSRMSRQSELEKEAIRFPVD